MTALAHNTARSGTKHTAPVIVQGGEHMTADERANWHEASDQEVAAYDAYWRGKNAAQDALEAGVVPEGERLTFRAYRTGDKRDWKRPWLIGATHPNADGNEVWAELLTVSEATHFLNGASDGRNELRPNT